MMGIWSGKSELVDKYDPEVRKGIDVPRSYAYCNIVGQTRELEIIDTGGDWNCYGVLSSPVISCGVLILDDAGQPYGTLCQYDMARCEFGSGDC